VFYAQAFGIALKSATEGMASREIARRTGLSQTAVSRILGGRSWPDFVTMAQLDAGLDHLVLSIWLKSKSLPVSE
jgi:transcriptional regulator with XRE-family HTH domain